MRIKYNDIKALYEQEKCTLLTTEEEIKSNSMDCRSLFKYIAQCGHEREMIFSNFKKTKYGRNCKVCENKKTSEKYKQNNNYGIYRGIKIENKTTAILETIFINNFEYHHTYEGCHADYIIKPLNSTEDKWLPIQVKGATCDNQNYYRFRHVNNYDKYLMCCVGIKEDEFKFWLFNGSICNKYDGITITKNSKNYSKYELTQDKIVSYILDCYNNSNDFIYISYTNSMIPVAPKCQTEHTNRIKRFSYISNLFEIIYSNEMNNIYDCIINGLKVQDKSGYSHRFGISFGINKKINKKSVPYDNGEIDIFWLHVPNSTKFYVIPELILINEGYIKTANQEGKCSILLFPEQGKRKNTKSWAQKYLFDYNNLEFKKLQELFT